MKDTADKSLILRFYSSASGELRCRITDAYSHESWVLAEEADVRSILDAVERPKVVTRARTSS
jgi:hypothetical protein